MSKIKKLARRAVTATVILMLAFVMVLPTISHGTENQGNLEENNTIRVGYFQLDGFNEISKDGKFSGYGYEYLMEIAKYTGWKYDFICKTPNGESLTYESALKLLESGYVDLVCNVRKTREMEDAFLFPSLPIGNSYGILTTTADNTVYDRGHMETLSGITIGVVSGSDRNGEIEKYLGEKNIEHSIKEFSNAEAARAALFKTNEIDAIYTSSLRHQADERQILVINPDYFFAAVNKDNRKLCGELDQALEAMTTKGGYMELALYDKYYGSDKKGELFLTQEEKDYIKKNPKVVVGVDPGFIPIEYYKKTKGGSSIDNIRGMSGDVLRQISRATGITFEPILYSDYSKGVIDQKAQLFSACAADYDWANKNNVRLTKSYLKLPISAVANCKVENYTDPNLRKAVVKNYFLTEQVKLSLPQDKEIYFDSVEECVKAVNDGKADVTYMPTYSADYFDARIGYTCIRSYAIADENYELAFAVANSEDPILYRIINKALVNISRSEMNRIVFANISFNHETFEPLEFIYKHPLGAIAIACILCVAIILLISRYHSLRKSSNSEIHLSEERIHIALAQTDMMVWDYDLKTKKIIRTNGTRAWLGLSDEIDNVPESLITSEFVHPEYAECFQKMFDDILTGAKVASGIFKVVKVTENGKWTKEHLWLEVKLTNIFDSQGKVIRAVGLAENVSKKVEEELRLKDKASRDPLTKLLNITSFQACVQEFLKTQYKEEGVSALMLLDTDDFKMTNDTYGHLYGDEVLKGIATRLTRCFRSVDFIGRLGGDEFVIFMGNAKSIEVIEEKARQICNSLVFEKDDLITTCSVGVVLVPNQQTSYDELYRYADEAMYEAKKFGKCRYIIREVIKGE